MKQNEQSNEKDLNVFNDTFGEMLKEKETPEQKVETNNIEIPPPPTHQDGDLQDIMFGPPETPETEMTEEQLLEFPEDYVPQHAESQEWQEFTERAPLIPLTREQEARAVSIGLQEIRKMKEFMHHSYHHLTNEFNRVYAIYPILFTKDFDEAYANAHKHINQVMDDIEHLIAGDYDNIEAIKQDFTLTQAYDEKRQSVLHKILAYYNNKN